MGACRKLEQEELYEPGEIIPCIEEESKEGEPCGSHELMEFHRGNRSERNKFWDRKEKSLYRHWGIRKGNWR